ncbi:hypothetical protein BDQ12DRAFT_699174 [Crucibulum laeve]|uniref:NAD-dependent epimerase/dehydratase domain-containing protein n=1 Tax=Crucibulum laeve TaxID=68775 RepID=A0A5C3LXB0_9AGAR|nr:hypothetical protein BDQ12DRAFT_699174 [Crucibulum laeve]
MSEIVFVTGASGFLGSHVINQLLEGGYRVRAAARGQKAITLKAAYINHPLFEVVEISDIGSDQFPELLQNVDAVVHLAAPLPGREEVDTMFEARAINILRQAEKLGVKRFVVTGTTATATATPDNVRVTDDDWNPITKELAIASKEVFDIYSAAKKYAELAIWEWAEAHPHVEVTTIDPTFCYGPFTPQYPVPAGDFNSFSTALNIYQFIQPNGTFPFSPVYNDVRDVAKAHVLALKSPPTSVIGRKRVIFAAPHGFVFKDALELIERKRPELKQRLIKTDLVTFDFDRFNVDFERIEKVAGLKKEDFYSFEETLLDTIDSLLKVEEGWKKGGYVFSRIPTLLG